MKRQIE